MLQTIKNTFHYLTALIATAIYRYPASKMIVIGVTGTDGKTTTSELIYHILKYSGKKVSLVSTIRAVIGETEYDTGFHVTTPSSFQLQKYLRMAKDSGSEIAVLEVTSHALDQHRVLGASIDLGIITNVTHEHLDYHKTFRNYLNAKMKIVQTTKTAILNADDENFEYLKKKATGKIVTFAINSKADFTPARFNFKSNLPGEFNKYNILASVAAAKELDVGDQKIREAITKFYGIKGRMEEVISNKRYRIFIDFAHKPNALKSALTAVRPMAQNKVITVFGCAGLRDTEKRPMMGEIAAKIADVTIITAEDPRTEDVRTISEEIASGCRKGLATEVKKNFKSFQKMKGHYFIRIPDRQEAINFAIRKVARKGDIVLITGKGHEQSMCYGKTEYPWSDFKAVQKALHD